MQRGELLRNRWWARSSISPVVHASLLEKNPNNQELGAWFRAPGCEWLVLVNLVCCREPVTGHRHPLPRSEMYRCISDLRVQPRTHLMPQVRDTSTPGSAPRASSPCERR